jgi:antitoxin YefM
LSLISLKLATFRAWRAQYRKKIWTANLYLSDIPPMKTVSYTELRENLATLLDKVVDDQEAVLVERRGHETVALIAADELSSLLETVYLLRSPANAARLLESLAQAKGGKLKEMSLNALKELSGGTV